MPPILVTGSNGSLGSNVVVEAMRRGLDVRALVRNKVRAKASGARLIEGDALDVESLSQALEGCESLFHLVNVVIGKDWVETTARLLDVAIEACKRTGARLVFPANVWVFGRGAPQGQHIRDLIDERRSFAPCSDLGNARVKKETRIRTSGVRYVMVRLPEFYGPHVQTLSGPPLQRIAQGRTGLWFGPPDVEMEMVFMPDAAKVLLDVGLADNVDREVFHYPGAAPITPRAFFGLAKQVAGSGRFLPIPALAVRAAALVSPMARSFADILHLWEAPILLDGAKLQKRFPSIQTTPYAEGLAATITWLRANPHAKMYF